MRRCFLGADGEMTRREIGPANVDAAAVDAVLKRGVGDHEVERPPVLGTKGERALLDEGRSGPCLLDRAGRYALRQRLAPRLGEPVAQRRLIPDAQIHASSSHRCRASVDNRRDACPTAV